MSAKIIPFTFFLSLFLHLQSCEESTYKTYFGNSPVYLSYEDLRSAVKVTSGAVLQNPGKIFFKGNYIFIIDELKGIHIIDNNNPSSPVKKAFIELPGAMDLSVSGNTLYADSYVDLVIFDIENILNIRETGRMKDLLAYTLPPKVNSYPEAYVDIHRGVVTGWELKQIREKERFHEYYEPLVYYEKSRDFLQNVNPGGASAGPSGDGVGMGGSTARFSINGNVMYAAGEEQMKIIDITDRRNPLISGSIDYVWGVRTLFFAGSYMFLGTTWRMMIYDISDPGAPQNAGLLSPATACTPLIVDDTLAYVTLRLGTNCGGDLNVLNVFNIKNIHNPVQVISYQMTSPLGLGMDGNILFLCDAGTGLKIYDAEDPRTLTSHLLKTYSAIGAYSVVPYNDLLFLLREDGLYLYDYSDIQNITLLSSIVAD